MSSLDLQLVLFLNSSTNDERRDAYACDITYVTNNELGFDYLRDNMVIYKEKACVKRASLLCNRRGRLCIDR